MARWIRSRANQTTCTWRATVDKVVNRTCSDDRVFTAIEDYDAARAGCFARCSGRGDVRNTSDACWIYCLFATVAGPAALVPGGHVGTGGMPIELLEEAFERPFREESAGGCPAL